MYDNGKRGQTDVIVGFEDGRGLQAKEYGQPAETEKKKKKTRECIVPYNFQKETGGSVTC